MEDYPKLFAPATGALLAGHLAAFFHALPPDGAGGSLLLRAPFALAGNAIFGTQLEIYRFGAAACMLAAGGLGLGLARLAADRGRPVIDQAVIVLTAWRRRRCSMRSTTGTLRRCWAGRCASRPCCWRAGGGQTWPAWHWGWR